MRNFKQLHQYCSENGQLPHKIGFLKRLIAEIITSLLFIFTITIVVKDESLQTLQYKAVLFFVSIFVFLSEGIFVFDALVGKRYPWHEALFKRVTSLLMFAPFWLVVTGIIANVVRPFFIPDEKMKDPDSFALGITILVLFVIIYVAALVAHNYHNSLKYFILENEKLRQEKLRLDYFALQDQLNPHFLFNNLSTLMAIIPENPDKALIFTEKFTDVYRYVLKSTNSRLTLLEEELEFIRAYITLHKERLAEGFICNIEVEKDALNNLLPPLSLQYLVENAIKHNLATETRPLKLDIYTKNNRLTVSNNYQPRNSTYSTNTGLSNLKKRYQYLGLKGSVEVLNTNETFSVSIPLIQKSDHHEL
ncbi:sensor histidine kinase [Marinilabilia salmonicolor]|uniref:Histidine kinase n=1 Tax=Marinilabilia salmonicolor TaxID=989 RepID=A0A368VIN6_9BACT|nr:histidine kinase [Marinilabilia salmonicolor]RCW38871.1 histidine kinase [Marinilabilia salmonicolor]